MHREVLKPDQISMLPLLKLFKQDFYLVGGTALALQIGHRYSLDFDLFTNANLRRKSIKILLEKYNYEIQDVLYEDSIQFHCIINGVKLSFYQYPYQINPNVDFEGIINMPDILTLAAMKAFALGGRGKWKDYVDLYFVFKHHFSFEQACTQANKIFNNAFNDKLFRQQLSYFEDVDFTEEVEYTTDPISMEEVKSALTEISLATF